MAWEQRTRPHLNTFHTLLFWLLVLCTLACNFAAARQQRQDPVLLSFMQRRHDDLIELECISLPRSHTTNPTRHKRDVTQGHIYVCVGSGANTFGNLVYICTEPNVH